MEVVIIDKRYNKKRKDVKLKDGTVFVQVSEKEAIDLIYSLSAQISGKNPNSQRLESYDKNGIYFSIAVTEFKETYK